jgi:hypothetical protein
MNNKEPEPKKIEVIPDEMSAARFIGSKVSGKTYQALKSLEEAQNYPDGVVVLEGDWGGFIYLVCPASLVKCSVATLTKLLEDLSKLVWGHTDGGTQIYYERQPLGTFIAGGSGGGRVTEGVWVHPRFARYNLQSTIEDILSGQRESLEML